MELRAKVRGLIHTGQLGDGRDLRNALARYIRDQVTEWLALPLYHTRKKGEVVTQIRRAIAVLKHPEVPDVR